MGLPKLKAGEVPIMWHDPEAKALNITLDVPEFGMIKLSAVNTGVPHAVIFVDDVDKVDVRRLGRLVRWHPAFPKGVNVDFAEMDNPNTFKVRTYERGVEDETLCCGTGATAVAIVATLLGKASEKEYITLKFRGGVLFIKVFLRADGEVSKVIMIGTAHNVFEGLYSPD